MTPDACTASTHGGYRAYRYHGCRCPEAVEYMRARWRRKRPAGIRSGKPRNPDVDTVAVDRAIGGDRSVLLTVQELNLAVAELTRRGQSARAIAVRLGVSDRTVTRHRRGDPQSCQVEPVDGSGVYPIAGQRPGGTVQIGRPNRADMHQEPAAACGHTPGSDSAEEAA